MGPAKHTITPLVDRMNARTVRWCSIKLPGRKSSTTDSPLTAPRASRRSNPAQRGRKMTSRPVLKLPNRPQLNRSQNIEEIDSVDFTRPGAHCNFGQIGARRKETANLGRQVLHGLCANACCVEPPDVNQQPLQHLALCTSNRACKDQRETSTKAWKILYESATDIKERKGRI